METETETDTMPSEEDVRVSDTEIEALGLSSVTDGHLTYIGSKRVVEETLSYIKKCLQHITGTKPSAAPIVEFRVNDRYYNMSGKKIMHIFNHYEYRETRYFGSRIPSKREGTGCDVYSLTRTFEKLGFNVKTHTDLVYDDIIKVVESLTKEDHVGTSCVCVVILTHGGSGDELFAADRPYQFSDVLHFFETTRTLAGKPKLFFVQACRGGLRDGGNTVQTDSGSKGRVVLPSHADFLILRSTVEGFVSYRDVTGSFMVQELCKLIDNTYKHQDMVQILTLLNANIAYLRASVSRDPALNKKKQTTEVTFTLTKLLKF